MFDTLAEGQPVTGLTNTSVAARLASCRRRSRGRKTVRHTDAALLEILQHLAKRGVLAAHNADITGIQIVQPTNIRARGGFATIHRLCFVLQHRVNSIDDLHWFCRGLCMTTETSRKMRPSPCTDVTAHKSVRDTRMTVAFMPRACIERMGLWK